MLSRKATPELIGLWSLCVFGGLSHAGSLMGLLVPLVVSGPALVFSEHVGFTELGLVRDLLAISLAMAAFLNLSVARVLVMVLIPVSVLFGLYLANIISPIMAAITLAFSLVLYVPTYILIQRSLRIA